MTSVDAKSPRICGGFVLYLDYDGPMHNEAVFWAPKRGPYIKAEGFRLFEHAPLLAELLDPYPQVDIVLSTSWVRLYSCSKAAKRLPPALRSRVVGATYHSEMSSEGFSSKPRGAQVTEDVLRRQPKGWLALDDVDEGWPEWSRDKFIRVHEQFGISEPRVLAELKAKLAVMCGAPGLP